MNSKINILKNKKKELIDIIAAIGDEIPFQEIADSYEDLTMNIYLQLKKYDCYWIDCSFDLIEKYLKENLDEKQIIKKFTGLVNPIDKKLLNYILEPVFNDSNQDYSDDETEEPKEEIKPDDIVTVDELSKSFKWREHQIKAIQSTEEQGFKSGVHNMIMGAGKTFIILNMIYTHYKNNKNNNLYILVCTHQEILKDLFFDNSNQLDKTKIEFWKKSDIIDLEKFNFIDKINDKSKIIELAKDKPNLLVVNSKFLEILDNNNSINYNTLNFVILDESHGISAPELYRVLSKIKDSYSKHIIGLSATPLRKGANAKVKHIFSKKLISEYKKEEKIEHKLNIISNYDMVQAIKDDIILPPHYTIFQVNKTLGHKIGLANKEIITKHITELIPLLPYKKILCWTRTIGQMVEYYDFLSKTFPQFKIYCSSSKDKDYKLNTNYKEFSERENNCIMVAVNRFREGSDFKNLDTVIYMDRVKTRGILVSMQTAGRALRKDPKNEKKCGHVIDSFVNEGKVQIELLTIDKVIGYYKLLMGLTEEEDRNTIYETYSKFIKSIHSATFDTTECEITIPIDDNKAHDSKINLKTMNCNWTKLKEQIVKAFQTELKIRDMEAKKLEMEQLRDLIKGKITNIEDYLLFAKKYNKPLEPHIYFNEIWKDWHYFLSIKKSTILKDIWEEICIDNKLNSVEKYRKLAKKLGISEIPTEVYKFKNLSYELYRLFKDEMEYID